MSVREETPTSTPSNSQQNSPTKTSPSKSSKNKKKNDAKRRNANSKKQQQHKQQNESTIDDVNADSGKDSSANDRERNNISLNVRPSPSRDSNTNHSGDSLTKEKHSPHKKSSGNVIKSNHSTNQQQMEQKLDRDTPIDDKNDNSPKPQQPDEKLKEQGLDNSSTNSNSANNNGNIHSNKVTVDSHVWNRKQRENRELKEQLKLRDAQLQNFADRIKQQIVKIRELEASLVSTTRTCNQFEKLVQQELTHRTRIESENDNLSQTLARLKGQIAVHEKDRAANNELIRTLNATLMERETEVSILKLKMTRMQTSNSTAGASKQPPLTSTLNNASSSTSMTRQVDAAITYATSGRSNSEFSRNSYARSSMLAETAASTRSSTSQLQQINAVDRDASIWSKVPQELTPSKRPLLLERNFQQSASYIDPNHSGLESPLKDGQQTSTPLSRDNRLYKTLPKSMKSPEAIKQDPIPKTLTKQQFDESRSADEENEHSTVSNQKQLQQPTYCLITNLDESNSTSSGGTRHADASNLSNVKLGEAIMKNIDRDDGMQESTPYQTTSSPSLSKNLMTPDKNNAIITPKVEKSPPSLPNKIPSSPMKISSLKKIFNVFTRSDSSTEHSDSHNNSEIMNPPSEVSLASTSAPFQRGATRATLVGVPGNARGAMRRDFHTDKPFAEWDTDMLVDWLNTIGLSMYANQCRRWVKCGAHIMNATPAEVDKGLGITNHLHRKKLRLAISELNGDCDKITKAAAKLDYLWIARWLDDMGLPQYRDAFINARVDGRVLNYLTVEDLSSMGVKSILHHCSIRCGIKVLRSINFDLQLLKRRATADEVEQMDRRRQRIDIDDSVNDSSLEFSDVQLWTCHRVMEWLRMIDFAEFAPNLRGSGVHGGLLIYEDKFNIDTMSSLLGIPTSRTLLRRHLATFFDNLIGPNLVQQKQQFRDLPSNEQLNPKTNLKAPKKSPLWFGKLKGSKVGLDGTDEYLCPMYPVEPQVIKSPTKRNSREGCAQLPRIPESINV